MKVGLFGGSFNPIHTGHLIVIDQAIEQLELDKLIIMPAACNPLKINDTDMAPAEHRLAMARIATAEIRNIYPTLEVSNMEIKRGPPSYTIDTVRELKRENALVKSATHDEIVLIIGGDSYTNLPQWKNIKELAELVTFGIAHRNKYGSLVPSIDNDTDDWRDRGCPHRIYGWIKTTTIAIPTFDTSGTEVRGRIKEGRSIKYLVPDVVEQYIRNNGLYLTSK